MITVHQSATLTRDVFGDVAAIYTGSQVAIYANHSGPTVWTVVHDGVMIDVARDPSLVTVDEWDPMTDDSMCPHTLEDGDRPDYPTIGYCELNRGHHGDHWDGPLHWSTA